MEIGRAEIDRWSRLVRLALTPEEAERLAGELDRILRYVDSLQAVDTQGLEPLLYASEAAVLREDDEHPPLPRSEALGSARVTTDGHFAVPLVVESEEKRRAHRSAREERP